MSKEVEDGVELALKIFLLLMKAYTEKKTIDELIERFQNKELQQLEEDLLNQVAKEIPQITANELNLPDDLKGKDKSYQVMDVESKHPEVQQQKAELQMGKNGDSQEQGKEYTFDRMEKGKLVYAHGTGKRREEIRLSHSQLPFPKKTRGKMMGYEFMQQMKTNDLKKMVNNSLHVAERDGRQANRVMRQMMKQKLYTSQGKVRNGMVKTADLLQQKVTVLGVAVQNMGGLLDKQMQKLKELPEKVQNHPQYVKMQDTLLAKQEQGQRAVAAYQGMQKDMTNQLKMDLHAQYPELKLDQLTPDGVVALSRCATEIHKGGVEHLRTFVTQSNDPLALEALTQAEGLESKSLTSDREGKENGREAETNELRHSFNNQ